MSSSGSETNSTQQSSSQSSSGNGSYPREVAVNTGTATEHQEEDTVKGDDVEKRKITLLRAYSGRKTEAYMSNTARELRKQFRMVIAPRVKFVRDSKKFGTFDQPDFSSEDCWQNDLFDRMPRLRNISDRKRASLWMTYRRNMRKELSNLQAKWTSGIKKEFLKRK